jgi:hypothetical protein
MSQLGLTFYGLKIEYKKYLHDLLVRLSMNVEGFTYKDWYEMPVNLRNYYVTIVNKVAEERNKEIKKASR